MNTERMEETVRLSGFVLPEELEDKLERGVITPLQVEQIIREVSEKIDRVESRNSKIRGYRKYINELTSYRSEIRKLTKKRYKNNFYLRKRRVAFIKMITMNKSYTIRFMDMKPLLLDFIESEKSTKQDLFDLENLLFDKLAYNHSSDREVYYNEELLEIVQGEINKLNDPS